jgi:DNA-binding NarL/FixJ family response regulator
MGQLMIGNRHPQSTRPMHRGRPRATGPFETHAELVAAVLERHAKGKSMRGISRILGLSEPTITKIIRENR